MHRARLFELLLRLVTTPYLAVALTLGFGGVVGIGFQDAGWQQVYGPFPLEQSTDAVAKAAAVQPSVSDTVGWLAGVGAAAATWDAGSDPLMSEPLLGPLDAVDPDWTRSGFLFAAPPLNAPVFALAAAGAPLHGLLAAGQPVEAAPVSNAATPITPSAAPSAAVPALGGAPVTTAFEAPLQPLVLSSDDLSLPHDSAVQPLFLPLAITQDQKVCPPPGTPASEVPSGCPVTLTPNAPGNKSVVIDVQLPALGVPEPSGLVLLGPVAGLILLLRRRASRTR